MKEHTFSYSFQFHNGTINTFFRPAVLCLFGCFNSTTVQLILLKDLSEIFSCYKFQFHNGTINT